MNNEKNYIDILGYKVFSGTREEALNTVFNYKKVHIISGNPEVLFTGLNNEVLFRNFTSKSALIIPDGVGTQVSGKILNTPVQD